MAVPGSPKYQFILSLDPKLVTQSYLAIREVVVCLLLFVFLSWAYYQVNIGSISKK